MYSRTAWNGNGPRPEPRDAQWGRRPASSVVFTMKPKVELRTQNYRYAKCMPRSTEEGDEVVNV